MLLFYFIILFIFYFLIFGLFAGNLLVDDIDDKYSRAGYSVVYLKLLYVAYVISTASVLLNILIADAKFNLQFSTGNKAFGVEGKS